MAVARSAHGSPATWSRTAGRVDAEVFLELRRPCKRREDHPVEPPVQVAPQRQDDDQPLSLQRYKAMLHRVKELGEHASGRAKRLAEDAWL